MCLLILKIREQHTLPAVVQKIIVDDLQSICDHFISRYQDAIKFHLSKKQVDIDDELKSLLETNNFFEESIGSISSDWMLEKYCVDEPVEVPLKTLENVKVQCAAKGFKKLRGLCNLKQRSGRL